MKVVIMMSDNSVSSPVSREKLSEKADAGTFSSCFDCLVGNDFVTLRAS